MSLFFYFKKKLCKEKFCIEFLATRIWVGLWVLLFTLVMLALEGVYIINYVTRFTEEIFAFLIASVFLADAGKKIYRIFERDPIKTADQYCLLNNGTLFNQSLFMSSNQSFSSSSSTNNICHLYYDDDPPERRTQQPNIALLSLILLIGTCVIALALKKLRRSIFFGAYVRRTLSDVGMLISIILMVTVDNIIEQRTGVNTQVINVETC